jgi:hypothetical protein
MWVTEVEFDSVELGVGMPKGGVQQPRTECGHAEEGFDSLKLGVGMQRWGSTALNLVWACRGVLNWVWAFRGGLDSLELGVDMQRGVRQP